MHPAKCTHPVCSDCGSEEVYVDAFARWNQDLQDWELQSTFDEAFCENCQGETRLDWVSDSGAA